MQTNNSSAPVASPATASANRQDVAREFLIFGLGREEYAIDIRKVQELRGYDAVTHTANAPDHMQGVINLRGVIVPIIDMRISFGNAAPGYDASTVAIIVNVAGAVAGSRQCNGSQSDKITQIARFN